MARICGAFAHPGEQTVAHPQPRPSPPHSPYSCLPATRDKPNAALAVKNETYLAPSGRSHLWRDGWGKEGDRGGWERERERIVSK